MSREKKEQSAVLSFRSVVCYFAVLIFLIGALMGVFGGNKFFACVFITLAGISTYLCWLFGHNALKKQREEMINSGYEIQKVFEASDRKAGDLY